MAHVHVDEIVENLRCLVPHALDETRSAHDLAGASHQHLEDRKFLRGQLDRGAGTGHAAARGVEGQISDAEHGRPCGARPAEQGPDPRQELGEGERLGEVVVGSRAESADPVGETIPRGQHQDRGREITRPERTAHGDPVLPRQEPVEHDHVVLAHPGVLFAQLAGRRDVDHEAFLLEPLGEELGGLTVVLDQQNAHRGLS